MKCSFCEKEIQGDKYCLPTYEGKVDLASDVFSTVCAECCFGFYMKNSLIDSLARAEKL